MLERQSRIIRIGEIYLNRLAPGFVSSHQKKREIAHPCCWRNLQISTRTNLLPSAQHSFLLSQLHTSNKAGCIDGTLQNWSSVDCSLRLCHLLPPQGFPIHLDRASEKLNRKKRKINEISEKER